MSAACMSSSKNSWRMILDCNQVKSAFQVFVFGLRWLGLWSNAMPTLSSVQYILVSMGWMKSSKMVPMARNVYYFGSTFLRAIYLFASVALSNKKKQKPIFFNQLHFLLWVSCKWWLQWMQAFKANQCDICGASFGQTCYLETHVNKAHH